MVSTQLTQGRPMCHLRPKLVFCILNSSHKSKSSPEGVKMAFLLLCFSGSRFAGGGLVFGLIYRTKFRAARGNIYIHPHASQIITYSSDAIKLATSTKTSLPHGVGSPARSPRSKGSKNKLCVYAAVV